MNANVSVRACSCRPEEEDDRTTHLCGLDGWCQLHGPWASSSTMKEKRWKKNKSHVHLNVTNLVDIEGKARMTMVYAWMEKMSILAPCPNPKEKNIEN